jgi:hypothetical protein
MVGVGLVVITDPVQYQDLRVERYEKLTIRNSYFEQTILSELIIYIYVSH